MSTCNTGPWDVQALCRTPGHEIRPGSGVREAFYEGEPFHGRPTRVFAYYAAPEGAGRPAPAMVLVHGGGGTAFPEWARMWAARGYAALAMDLGGCGPNREPLPGGGPDQGEDGKFFAIRDGVRETWPYWAVAAVLRGHSMLAAQPEVDAARIGVTGISWGGYLTCIAAGVDERLRLAVPVYGCGFLHENSAWLEILARMPAADRELWIRTFDPSRYLPGARLPMLWVNGTNDFAYPLDSYRKSYRAAPGPRTLCVTVGMDHGHEAGWAPMEIGLFADHYLRGGEALPRLGPVRLEGGRTLAAGAGGDGLRAGVHWTEETGPWPQRRWQSAPARVQGGVVRGDLPVGRPLAAFLTVTDARGATVSTEHVDIG